MTGQDKLGGLEPLSETAVSHSGGTVRATSLSKAIRLLRLVAKQNATGTKLTEVARLADINIATTHRLLSALVDENMLSFDPYSKLYFLGAELFAIVESGETHTAYFGLRTSLHPVLQQVSTSTGDTTFLSVLSQGYSFCIDKVSGSYPVSINTLDIGARRPLGVGAGSLALLCALPVDERAKAVEASRDRYQKYGHLNAAIVEEGIRFYNCHGYALNDAAIIPDVGAVGVPVFDTQGALVAAVSLGAVSSRLQPQRRVEIVELIRHSIKNSGFCAQR